MEPTYQFLVYGILISLALIEAIVLLTVRRGAYDWRAALCSLVDFLLREYLVGAFAAIGPAEWLLRWAWAHRVATIPLDTTASVVGLFLGQEFCYYWFHRCSHYVRLLWANHAVHHSTNELNLSAAIRFGWTSRLVGMTLFLGTIYLNP